MTTLTPELTLDTAVDGPSDAEAKCHWVPEDPGPLFPGGLIAARCGRIVVLDSDCSSPGWSTSTRCPDCHREVCQACNRLMQGDD